jgi:hypothetical protein
VKRRLYKEEIYDLYSSPNVLLGNKIKKDKGGAHSTYGGYERCKRFLLEKSGG